MTTFPYYHESVDRAFCKWVDNRVENRLPDISPEIFNQWLEEEYGMTTIGNGYSRRPDYYKFQTANDMLMFLIKWA